MRSPHHLPTTKRSPIHLLPQSDRPQPNINNQRSPLHLPIKKRSPLIKNQQTAITPSFPHNKAIAPNQISKNSDR